MSNVNLNNTDNSDYVRGYKDGKKAGALHEAERAKGLVDALKEAKKILNILDNSDAIEIINTALAKYKEVSNG
jgi:hypothetical protein